MKQLSIHVFMHVPYEGLGCIANWIQLHNHILSFTKFYETSALPSLDHIDWLIIMGGPMSVNEENQFSWLKEEKQYIKEAIEKGKTVLGICLGSQLIAEVLGAKVYPNKVKEIGWFPISKSEHAKNVDFMNKLENEFTVFHWHGDTYHLPKKSILLFSSFNCQHQGFSFENRVIGLQFHFEVTEETIKAMVENGKNELLTSETFQNEVMILSEKRYIEANNLKMYILLDGLSSID